MTSRGEQARAVAENRRRSSELAAAEEAASILCSGIDPKAGRGEGKLYSGRKGGLQGCPDWLLAWGSWGWAALTWGTLNDWLGCIVAFAS